MGTQPPITLNYGQVANIEYFNDDTKDDLLIVNAIYPATAHHRIPIVHDSSINELPLVGDFILYIQFNANYFRILKTWAIDPLLNRTGTTAINPGEIHLQSATGRSYVYLDILGNAIIVDGSMQNSIKVLQEVGLINLESFNFKFNNFNGGSLTIDSGNNLSFIAAENPANPRYTLKIDSQSQTKITTKNYTLLLDKDGNVKIDGVTVSLGQGAAADDSKFGNVVTGGKYGTYPYDPITGKQIVGSKTVKSNV